MKEFIEKLIGRLEEIKSDNFASAVLNEPYSMGICHTIEKSIEIVNQLAEEYNNDFCEWKGFDNSLDENSVDWVYETTCGKYIGENHTSSAFQYCPYCGKKIKVAPYQPKGE